ncbi:MAG: uroporphyrinogen decarboxylase family protein, partial [Rhodospirillales bacterium]|nr:uroporphyrinogen decarboxylase family protein [Rhodospirillales bacterium]
IIEDTIIASKNNPSRQIFIPLHWGLDNFMSPEQFELFFWPPLRKVLMGFIEADLIPCVLWEGDCTTRLETIADIPVGKAVYWFEQTDMGLAKSVLGGITCLRGNVSSSVLITGTPDDVDEECKKLIKVAGKGGGFILDGAIGLPDEAKVENVIAMAESVRKYAN